MRYKFAAKLLAVPGAAGAFNLGVTRPVPTGSANAAHVGVTIYAVAGTPLIALQESNDQQNWENNTTGLIMPTAGGFYEFDTTGIAAQYVRLGCLNDSSSLALLAADIELKDL